MNAILKHLCNVNSPQCAVCGGATCLLAALAGTMSFYRPLTIFCFRYVMLLRCTKGTTFLPQACVTDSTQTASITSKHGWALSLCTQSGERNQIIHSVSMRSAFFFFFLTKCGEHLGRFVARNVFGFVQHCTEKETLTI